MTKKVDEAEEALVSALEYYSPIYNAVTRRESPKVAAAIRVLIEAIVAQQVKDARKK